MRLTVALHSSNEALPRIDGEVFFAFVMHVFWHPLVSVRADLWC